MRPPHRLIIAIDGPAGAGKSTVARQVAERLNYRYLDTGAMYRAVALKALNAGADLGDPARLAEIAEQARIELETAAGATRVWLDGVEVTQAIREAAVSEAASRVSAVPAVRAAMVRLQRQWGAEGGIVMEGRDIGTVVFPEAEVKVYLDASPAERARRRALEMAARGIAAPVDMIAREMAQRDARDTERRTSPLRRAADAVVLDTDGLSPEEVVDRIVALCRHRGAEE